MRTCTARILVFQIMALVASGFAGCSGERLESVTYLDYATTSGWSCESGESCQDVYDIVFEADSLVTFSISNVQGGSVAQLALYAPGVPPGGINLFTTTTDELRCRTGAGCDDYTAGELVTGFPITVAGTYRFAVTRHGGDSCGETGTYLLNIISDTPFSVKGRTLNDAASPAADYSCTL